MHGMRKINKTPRLTLYGLVREYLIVMFLLFAVFLVYSNTREAPFALDDKFNVEHNPHIRIESLSPEKLVEAGFQSPLARRPVANVSFAVGHYLHRNSVKGFRFVNIFIHMLTGVFLYFLIRSTLRTPGLQAQHGRGSWLPFFAALLWLLHPAQTQSVTYVVQRMNCLAAMFYILSLLFYVRGRLAVGGGKKFVLYAAAVLAGVMALGSKEIAATLPLFVYLYEWYFFQNLDWSWFRRRLYPLITTLAVLATLTFFYLGNEPLEFLLSAYQYRDFTLGQRLLTQFRVVVFYLSLILFPHPARLNLDHYFLISTSLIEPLTTLFSVLVLLVLVVAGFLMARRELLISFCIFWFLGNLLIESSVIALEIVFEHRLYLPSMMIVLMAVVFTERYLRPVKLRVAVLSCLAVVSAFWTYERNHVWRDEVSLWNDSAVKSPLKARPQNNLGLAFMDRGDFGLAIEKYLDALKINPDYGEAHYNLSIALLNKSAFFEAEKEAGEALRVNPRNADAHSIKGIALARQGKLAQATESFSEALRLKPNNPDIHYNIAISLAEMGDFRQALKHNLEVLRLKPDYDAARFHLREIQQKIDQKGIVDDSGSGARRPADR